MNLTTYNKVFTDLFSVSEEALNQDFKFGPNPWDSFAHMELIAALEDAFDIMLETTA